MAQGPRVPRARRGSALLAVLWLSAALAAIGFSLATTIHGETERTSTALDGLRSYYLAAAGIDRAAVEALWGIQNRAHHPRVGHSGDLPFRQRRRAGRIHSRNGQAER
jgi:type II secretory pathway component PulK